MSDQTSPAPFSAEERKQLIEALHDAIRRPMGVVPASAEPWYSPALADAADERREWHLSVPPGATGLCLCKVVAGHMRFSHDVFFDDGRNGVINVLTKAQSSGHVGGEVMQLDGHWADFLDREGQPVGRIRLSKEAWSALKTKWMPCKMASR